MAPEGHQVVDGYRDRTAFARAESHPATLHLLEQALEGVGHAAEFPCGPGHFLAHYARAKVRVTLIDASAPMLAIATQHARQTGVQELAVEPRFLHQFPPLPGVGLVVIPNAALNQLAAQLPLKEVMIHLRNAVAPGTRLLLQYLTRQDEAGCCVFYTPGLPDGRWVQDHRFPDGTGQQVTRRRRQHHTRDGARVRIEFAYTIPGHSPRTAQVHLALPTAGDVEAALASTGWSAAATGFGVGFRELLATAGGDG